MVVAASLCLTSRDQFLKPCWVAMRSNASLWGMESSRTSFLASRLKRSI